MKDLRADKRIEAAVNRGLAAALLVDTPAGVDVMSKAHVPVEVIARVILTPQNRRATDWKH